MSLLSKLSDSVTQYLKELRIAILIAAGAKPVPVRENRTSSRGDRRPARKR